MAEIYGIDIASYQGDPNFDQVKAAGKEFVITKLTEGTTYVNPHADRSRRECHRVGLVVGLYHFARGGDPKAEADYFCVNAGGIAQGELVVLDWEINHTDPVGWCKTWLDQVHASTGVRPLVYLNLSTITSLDWSPVANANYGLWLAYYDNNPNGVPATDWPMVAMKQYTSSGGVPGISGAVDLNVFFGNREQLLRYAKEDGSAPATVPLVVAPAPAVAASNDYVVQRGDSLSKIASDHGLGLQQVLELNPQIANPSLIYPGQIVHLGGAVASYHPYKVIAGDTLGAIALKFGMTLTQLLLINPQITNPNLIQIGQEINVK